MLPLAMTRGLISSVLEPAVKEHDNDDDDDDGHVENFTLKM